jgi:hypothetical protein
MWQSTRRRQHLSTVENARLISASVTGKEEVTVIPRVNRRLPVFGS